jgi:AcrR family transcriptional regulator
MATRAEKKARTRNALIDSVLSIVGYGANFASISLREVAKTAGVVPTSFYRHFGDMEELGLTMVDELGLNLRRLMRGSFDAAAALDDMIDQCVEAYQQYVIENSNLLQFMNQSRTGGTPALQDAIRNELRFVSSRIATELAQVYPHMQAPDREIAATLIVSLLLENTTELLAVPEGNEALLRESLERTRGQMRLIMAGAQHWRDGASANKKVRKKK